MNKVLATSFFLLYSAFAYTQDTRVIVGASGFLSKDAIAFPHFSISHKILGEVDQLSGSFRFSQFEFNNRVDEYVPEISLLYSRKFHLWDLDLLASVGPSGMYTFNNNDLSPVSKFYWGGRTSVGFGFKSLFFEVSYLVLSSEINDTFLPIRSNLGFGLGYRF